MKKYELNNKQKYLLDEFIAECIHNRDISADTDGRIDIQYVIDRLVDIAFADFSKKKLNKLKRGV